MGLTDDYRAIREGAAIGTLAPRGQIAVAGGDRRAYLQGLLTNDIVALQPGSGCYSAWLTPQGRMITDLHVLESDSLLLLDVPATQLDAALQRLDQFLFSEDVRLESLSGSLTGVWLHGPEAPAVLERTLRTVQDAAGWAAYAHVTAALGDTPVVLARIDQLGVPGFCAYVDPAAGQVLTDALAAAGAVRVGSEALAAARIEEGYPLFGIDMTEDTIPLEAGIEERAISFSKGCYVGQEIIIRVLHRGGGRVARKLVALRVTGAVPERDVQVLAGEKVIGSITSAAASPRFGPIALAYVHRDFVAPGTAVDVALPSGRVPATVSTRPMTAAPD